MDINLRYLRMKREGDREKKKKYKTPFVLFDKGTSMFTLRNVLDLILPTTSVVKKKNWMFSWSSFAQSKQVTDSLAEGQF